MPLYTCTAGIWSCLQVEADEDAAGQAIFPLNALSAAPPRLYHVVVVLAPEQPLALYVDGQRLPFLYFAATDFDGSVPISPQFSEWGFPRPHSLLLAPLMRHVAQPWAGDVHALSVYGVALDAAQVEARRCAFLADSAPLAPSRLITTREDTPVELELRGTDAFDATYSPRPQLPLVAYLTSLPTAGRLWFTEGSRDALHDLEGLTPVASSQLPLDLRNGRKSLCASYCLSRPRLTAHASATYCLSRSRLTAHASATYCLLRPRLTAHASVPCAGLWFHPPPNAFSRGNTSAAAVATLGYKVNDGHHDSLVAQVAILARPVNDAPTPLPATVDAFLAGTQVGG